MTLLAAAFRSGMNFDSSNFLWVIGNCTVIKLILSKSQHNVGIFILLAAPFLFFLSSQFYFFMMNILQQMKKFLVEMINRLFYNTIHELVW